MGPPVLHWGRVLQGSWLPVSFLRHQARYRLLWLFHRSGSGPFFVDVLEAFARSASRSDLAWAPWHQRKGPPPTECPRPRITPGVDWLDWALETASPLWTERYSEPSADTPGHLRRLAESEELVESLQIMEYLMDHLPLGSRQDYRGYPPRYGDPYYHRVGP